MLTNGQKKELYLLLNGLCEDVLTEDQFHQLDGWLGADPEACEIYVDFMNIWSDLRYFQTSLYCQGEKESASIAGFPSGQEPSIDVALWQALEADEKTAPALNLSRTKPKRELIQKVVYPQKDRKVNKRGLLMEVFSAAAILLVLVFVQFVPDRSGREVASLTDSMGAKWMDNGVRMVPGARLMNTDAPFILNDGFAELLFDNGTKVIVEAPSEFRVITADQIQLDYGTLFVSIEQAPGNFTVQTLQAKIIDLGTQFGVCAGLQGETELHVIEGKTLLISGLHAGSKTVESVGAGQACGVDLNGNLQSVPFRHHRFVRGIDAELGTAWRGHRTLDLASIVSGSDGLVTEEGVFAIDPLTGARNSSISGKGRLSNAHYNAVADSPFIDGVFVPVGGNNTVTSAGHIFACPPTGRYFTRDITVLHGIAALEKDGLRPGTIGNMQDPMVHRPRIMMHSNVGITFNLSTIRRLVGSAGNEPYRFRASSETRKLNEKTLEGYLDFFILVDGQVRFEKKAFSSKDQRVELDIPLGPEDEFLSLVVTDCMQLDPVKGGACNNDFLYLIGPTLMWPSPESATE